MATWLWLSYVVGYAGTTQSARHQRPVRLNLVRKAALKGADRIARMVAASALRKSSLSIPGIAQADIERLDGQGGGSITIEGHPLCIAPGKAATVARSSRFTLKDHGWWWVCITVVTAWLAAAPWQFDRAVGITLVASGLWVAAGAWLSI